MANERQREIGRWIKERYPKGEYPQQEFKMVLNGHLQHGTPEDEAVALAIASVRERYPNFTPVEYEVSVQQSP